MCNTSNALMRCVAFYSRQLTGLIFHSSCCYGYWLSVTLFVKAFNVISIVLQHGKLKDVRIVTYRNGSPKGLAYVEYEDEVGDQHSFMSVAFLKMEPATFDLFVRNMLEAVRCELTVCSNSVVGE